MNKDFIEKIILTYLNSPEGAQQLHQNNIDDVFIGKYVICRTYAAGVHVGVLKTYDANTRQALLAESRRIWSWEGAFTLSEMSQAGINGGKIAISLNEILITQIEEIIPCSPLAEKNLRDRKAYQP